VLSDAELEVIADNLARLQLPRVTHLKVAVAVIGPAHDAGSPARTGKASRKRPPAAGVGPPRALCSRARHSPPGRGSPARSQAGPGARSTRFSLGSDTATTMRRRCCVTSRRGRRRARRASCPRPSPRAQPSPRPPLRTGAVAIFPPTARRARLPQGRARRGSLAGKRG